MNQIKCNNPINSSSTNSEEFTLVKPNLDVTL